jgi:glycosyltransferase involved in cell wall biosynthesis
MVELRRHFPDVGLTIIGEGPARAGLEAQVSALDLRDVVHLVGPVDDPLPAMRAADLFVLSSRYEGFANVVLEALACGTPVVAARSVSGVLDMIVDRENGWLGAATDTPSLAAALVRACTGLAGVDRRAITARCRERHSVERTVHSYESLLTAVATGTEDPRCLGAGLPDERAI